MKTTMNDMATEFLDDAVEGLEEHAERLKKGAAYVARGVAEKAGKATTYARRTSPSDMLNDVQEIVKRYPAQSLLIATCLGFLLAYSMRRDD
jgi:hypothetical protein